MQSWMNHDNRTSSFGLPNGMLHASLLDMHLKTPGSDASCRRLWIGTIMGLIVFGSTRSWSQGEDAGPATDASAPLLSDAGPVETQPPQRSSAVETGTITKEEMEEFKEAMDDRRIPLRPLPHKRIMDVSIGVAPSLLGNTLETSIFMNIEYFLAGFIGIGLKGGVALPVSELFRLFNTAVYEDPWFYLGADIAFRMDIWIERREPSGTIHQITAGPLIGFTTIFGPENYYGPDLMFSLEYLYWMKTDIAFQIQADSGISFMVVPSGVGKTDLMSPDPDPLFFIFMPIRLSAGIAF